MKHNLKLVSSRPSERVYGSPSFLRLGRNPELESPRKFVPTEKADGDVVI